MRHLPLLGLLLCASGAVHAQTDLPNSQVRVEKLFDARLLDAKRIDVTPTLPALDTSIVTQRYEVVPVESTFDYEPPRIRPLAVKVDEPPTPYKGFARLGAGLPAAFIADLGYVTQTDRYVIRADGHGYGFKGEYNDDQRYAEVNARVGGTYYATEEVAVDFDVDYDRRQYRYYGFGESRRDTAARLPAPLNRQHFGTFGLRAGVRNAQPTTSGIDYAVHLTGDFLSDNFDTRENQFKLDGFARRKLSEAWYAEFGLDLAFVRLTGLRDDDLNVFQFKPLVGAHFDKLGLRLGAIISNENDVFAFYPNLEASYALNPTLVLVAGADGGPRQQTYRSMSRYLPYLISQPDIRVAQEYRFFGGVQTKVRGIDVKATASYRIINDLALFVNDVTEFYKFVPRYDSANVFGLKLEASAPILARLSGHLQIENRIFDFDGPRDPYLLPSFDAEFRARYEIKEGVFGLSGLLVAQNALPVLQPNTFERELETGTLLDLSVHADYRLSERFGAFAQANNLLNNRRRQFPFYPVLGTNFLVGVTARF